MVDALIDYTNWQGERRVRRIQPLALHYGKNKWHPEEQWMLYAIVRETGEARYFAMDCIHSWRST
jgi:predicted DNA-binding transcriptional regulator YafY